MKKLNELYNCEYDITIKDIKINSKEVKPGDIFVCTKGITADRHDFIDDAIKNGASALVVSRDVNVDIPFIKVEDTNEELPKLAARFYDYPDKDINLIGITGTDGKTSTATIIQTLIGNDKCGYIGTNGVNSKNYTADNPNTTPDTDLLYKYFRGFLNSGCKYVAMEASSEAFFRDRLKNFEFNTSVYTNITSEHLNIHGSLENYIECKCKLFEQTKSDGSCILNKDDEYYETVLKHCKAKVYTYGKSKDNDLQIIDFKVFPTKTIINLKYQEKNFEVISPLLGDFNVYNLCAALLTCLSMGFQLNELLKNIKYLKIDGRLNMLDIGQNYYVMVDYAHTPNGITKLLNFVHTLDINKSIVVIGQAGERDYLKRPIVGEVVVNNSSYAIFTYEDPRSEDPKDICNDIIKNIKNTHNNYEIVIDRHEAIKKAINMANEKDIVLILGKGNETYEKLKDKVIYFNDVEEAMKALKEREGVRQ